MQSKLREVLSLSRGYFISRNRAEPGVTCHSWPVASRDQQWFLNPGILRVEPHTGATGAATPPEHRRQPQPVPAAAPGLRQGGKFLKSVSINQNFLFSPVPVQCSVPVLVNYFQPVLYTSCQFHRGGGKTLSGDKMSVKGDWNEDTAVPALAQHWPSTGSSLSTWDIRMPLHCEEVRGQKGGCGLAAVIGQKISPSSLHQPPASLCLVCLVNSLREHSGISSLIQ